jgi:replicative DNA helicase
MDRLGQCDYLQRRSISRATTHPLPIGFCPHWKNPEAIAKGYNPRESPRLIIPLTRYSYFARDTRPIETLSEYEKRFIKINVGQTAIFNRKILATAKEPIFITEGAIDALSIMEAGHIAIGLGGVDKSKLIQAIEEYRPTQPFIISLDGDKAGETAAQEIATALNDIQIDNVVYSISDGENKDPNEMLVNEPQLFKEMVEKALSAARQ